MAHAGFVHLRVHTAFSLSEGAIPVKKLVGLVAKAKMPAVAVTDSNNLFGALEFSDTAVKSGLQPIMGVQLSIAPPGSTDPRAGRRPDPDPIVLLAQNAAGLANLLRLSSAAYTDPDHGRPPEVAIERLAEATEGLLCLAGGAKGPVGRLLFEGQKDAARELLARFEALFPGRLYIEIQRHGMEDEEATEADLIDLAYERNLPLVATNDCYFADEGAYAAHDALLCIAEGSTVGNTERRRLTPGHRFRSAEEMRELFADLPEAVDNTLVIARRCAVRAKTRGPLLPPFPCGEGHDEISELRRTATEGLHMRLAKHVFTPEMDEEKRKETAVPYWERLEFELGIIIRMKFPGYFLIVSDFIQWAKRQGIPVGPGRGSGAGSLVAWALQITDVDPLRFGLLFERFLNPERVSMPDFDIDFCQDKRDRVIRYVVEKYGQDKVAQIITFGKLQARAVMRDVGRVLEMPLGQIDKLAKMVPNNPANPVTLEQAIEMEPRLQQARDEDETVKRLIDIALKLEGLYRHASTHAAGVVIGDRPLVDLVPLYRDPRSDMLVTQYNMKWVEPAGLIKFDFLGLKTLTVLDLAVRLIANRGITIDLAATALEDKKSYEILARGDTVGVFQLESSGMRDALKKLKPDCFEDIVAMVALYRPGPMDNIPKYIACKHGEEAPDYLHPKLEGVLKETYGVIIYQEQVMQIAQILAGYSLGEADLLRRAMGKKIKEEMDQQRIRFVQGAEARGVDPKKADEIFDLVNKFAGYGFNKSHAVAYALVAYHTAYLKANYPVEFMAAIMTLDLANTDKLNVFRQELGRMKIPLLQPDINRSDADFAVEAQDGGSYAIRYALAAIKIIGHDAIEKVLTERKSNGLFKSVADFANRLDPKWLNRRQVENLAKAGAFDSLEKNRARVCTGAEAVVRFADVATRERESQQESLFGGGAAGPADTLALPAVPPWSAMDQSANEFEAIGFYLSAHPMDGYGKSLDRLGITRLGQVERRIAGGQSKLRIAGIVLSRQEKVAKSGNRFAFVKLTDQSGVVELTVFSEVLVMSRDLLEPGTPVLVEVEGRIDGEMVRMMTQSIQSLDKVVANSAAGVRLYLADAKAAEGMKGMLAKVPKGKGRIALVLGFPEEERELEFELPDRFAVSPSIVQNLRSMPGIERVVEL
ncbi:DNA polymerase III subunit alpha [Zavarzinia compransoris]|uniref:DNA polymerase III subunit alpha n=1 Tax=Zavarzinia compransoris TaxID=1264899 RepID=A0A317EC07_9PROT|nr:DNA polymerase III subunit alpha [Zavarzinia compransoris]PWR23844.1 DNA polymerase III subunit alpha [Zavarzinia compransoris]TDP48080.1 DNA polymerase III alpha subunit [Zavarzinia compransoris]